jgi:hypothetical protein
MSEFKVVYTSQDSRWPDHVVVSVQTDREADEVIRLVDAAPDLLAVLNKVIEAACTVSNGSEVVRAKRDEQDDIHTHERWAMEELDKVVAEALLIVEKVTA